ncbi:MAG: NUDIX domain-containing protein [Nanoarchaeota archaeon]|nr:NUDIX domain-containing protein [DPANN group archaeon]MBL7116903.1 NUDIX domain-containing protein [Nanoarchaeota archaeon]
MVELAIEVDEKDNVIGVRPKEEFRNSNFIHRSSHLYLFNSKGEFLVQKRAFVKKSYPGLFDASVSGTVRDGETYEQTLEREMKEELGISVPYSKLFKYEFSDDVDKAIKTVFKATYDGPFKLQKEEVEAVYWMSLGDIKQKMSEHPEQFCPPFFKALKICFKNKFLEKNDENMKS